MKKLYNPAYVWFDHQFQKGMGVLAEDDTILAVNTFETLRTQFPHASCENWSDLVLVPGTINAHNHCFQSLLRGLSCDRPFLEWRDQALYKYSPRMRLEDIYCGALFAFAEMMKCGVTTVCDFFYLHNFGMESDEMIIKAAKDIGIRLVLARTMYDWDGAPRGYVETISQAVQRTKSLALKYREDPMIAVVPAPHSLHAATPEMIQAGDELAKELNTKFHIHVAEEPFEVEAVQKAHDGLRPIEYLDRLGVVNSHMVIIHGVWLAPQEIDLLGTRGGSLIYCPSSNMFLADGITDLPHMMRAGVTVGLGSDGACSNNRISVFEEMRMAALLQKAKTCDAMCVNYQDTFLMGTENGGKILDLPIGTIAPGQKADFVGITLQDMSMQPVSKSGEQLLPNIVYSMQPHAIKRVVVGGKNTVINGQLCAVEESHILELVSKTMQALEA